MRARKVFSAVDSHTEGMPTRVITSGPGVLPGNTMYERMQYLVRERDDLRTLLMYEPRGHAAMSGAILQPPTRPDANMGVVFIEVSGCLPMCGHGAIGTATVLVETGMVEATEPVTVIRLDTPAGLVEAWVAVSLLQTESYARALLSTRAGESEEQIDAMVTARLARQAILDRDKPPTCWFMLDEGVLRRCVGSPAVMKEQLIQLADLAQRPDIVVQVIPLDAGAHQGLNGGAFVIADLPDSASVAYQDTALAGQILESADDIESLMLAWDTLRSEALPRNPSHPPADKAAMTGL